ncbi:hypothetical protein BV898_15914 [Hypsibius exemplaris]|uniref:Chitin-binding type-2 domain-containing protein n=1 Tax=Hypsibius exemplaris TaxID=2072580 RepID=A0A9X6NE22_HYPEX|nr:hypothetical protein BV898_15914 [Hypsibius exemplaris]
MGLSITGSWADALRPCLLLVITVTSVHTQKLEFGGGSADNQLVAAASSYSSGPQQSGQYNSGYQSGGYGSATYGSGYSGSQVQSGNNNYGQGGYDARPETYGFSCYGKPAALYGDGNYDCRIFHVCQADGRGDTLHCPPKTRFNNYLGVCDWEFKIDRTCLPTYQEESYNSGAQNQNYGQIGGSYGVGQQQNLQQKYR